MRHIMRMLTLLSLVGVLAACGEVATEVGQTGTLELRLTDAPADYAEINVIISRVEARRAGASGWETLIDDDEAQEINLLGYQNGLIRVLGQVELPAGRYNQMRLIVAGAGVVTVDGEEKTVFVPSGEQTGIKLSAFEIEPDTITAVTLDFDARASLVARGGPYDYNLKPVVRAVADTDAGTVFGRVVDAETGDPIFGATVTLYAEDDDEFVTTAITSEVGDFKGDETFKVIALLAGDYWLEVEAEGYQTTRVDFEIEAQLETDLGDIELEPENGDNGE